MRPGSKKRYEFLGFDLGFGRFSPRPIQPWNSRRKILKIEKNFIVLNKSVATRALALYVATPHVYVYPKTDDNGPAALKVQWCTCFVCKEQSMATNPSNLL